MDFLATLAIIPILQLKNPVIPQPTPTTSVMVGTKKPAKQKPTTYKVKENDTLTRIAKKYKTSWKRIYYKNKSIKNPDVLLVGQKLTIPKASERLKERKIATSTIPAQTSNTANFTGISRPIVGNTSGNSYEPGQCVWFIKNMRPEIPNSWGSASSWLSSAQSQGWPTGSTPRVGAVGWTHSHVVLITAVNKDGTVDITDMNGRWIPYEIGYGTYPASKYQYIY